MTVSSTTVKNSYSGDGSNDTFVYGFKIFASSDLQVIIRSATGTETTKTLTTDYTVTGVGTASGGNVVFEAAAIPTATETVVLIRNVPQTQAPCGDTRRGFGSCYHDYSTNARRDQSIY
jgi:hypothetical protein